MRVQSPRDLRKPLVGHAEEGTELADGPVENRLVIDVASEERAAASGRLERCPRAPRSGEEPDAGVHDDDRRHVGADAAKTTPCLPRRELALAGVVRSEARGGAPVLVRRRSAQEAFMGAMGGREVG